MIRKNAGIFVIKVDYHDSSRIINIRINIKDNIYQLLNVYGHSGSNLKTERELLFSHELLFYLQNNLENVILGGDLNCIIRDIDAYNTYSYLKSESLKKIVSDLKLVDVHNVNGVQIPQYTFIKQGYGSRIDRFYVNKLKHHILDFETIPVSFTDHHAVLFKLNIPIVQKIARKSYWKFNNSFVDDKEIYALFKKSWEVYKRAKPQYSNPLVWWENTKLEIADLFKKKRKTLK